MLEIILDKNFFDNFPVDSSDILYLDFIKFLKKIRKYRLITNYSSIEEMSNSEILPLIEFLIDGKPPDEKIKFCDIDKYIEDEIINGFDRTYPFKLFLVEKDYSKLSDDYGFEFLNSKNIAQKWKPYSSERNDKKRKVTNDNIPDEMKFNSWETIKRYGHPFNSLIIFDLYILGDKDGQKIDDNLFPFLKNFLENNKLKIKLNITIITEHYRQSIEQLHSRISEFIKSISNIKDFNLNIIKHNKKFYPAEFQDLNIRRIYTNYYVFEPEKGLNCFKDKYKVAAIQNICFSNIFEPYTNATHRTELNLLKKYVQKVLNIEKSEYLSEEINYYKDKVSHRG